MGKRYSSRAPLRDEAAVRELLALMEEYNAPGRKELAAMVAQITGLERQLDEASRQIEAMRKELAEVREGPVKRTLTKAVRVLERGAALLGERLDDLKAAIVDGCKRTLAAVRERGISVLAHTARFFHLGPAVEAVNRLIDHNISTIDRDIALVERDSRNYHEAGRRVRNAGRALLGQEPVADAKGQGKLADAAIFLFQKEKSIHLSMRRGTEHLAERLSLLEQAARPPIRQTMEAANKKLAQERQGQERPAPALEHDGR